jgi:RecA-family ATPase
MLGAHGGVGKSTIALMLAVCAALERPLFGVDTVQCKVLFVSLEDSAHIVRHRLAFISRIWGINPIELEGKLHIVDGTENPELFIAENRGTGATTATYIELRKLVQSEGVGLVVVDNASDAFGGDEIQRKQVRAFVRSLAQLAPQTRPAVLLLAHVDKTTSRARKAEGGEGYSGSTAWHNSVRSRLFMTRAENDAITLEHQKSNLGKRRELLKLEWSDGGLPMLANDTPDASGITKRITSRADDDRAVAVLKMIAEFEGRGQYCSPAPQARNNVYALLRSEPTFLQLKLKPDDTKRIVNQCQRAKWLASLEYRGHGRLHERWTVTPEGHAYVGLAPPHTPTSLHIHENECADVSIKVGCPTPPHMQGGTGGATHTFDGAQNGAVS